MPPEHDSKEYEFRSIAHSFERNVRALRVFNERIGTLAAEHDRSAINAFLDAIKTISPGVFAEETLEIDSEEGDTEDSSQSDLDTEPPKKFDINLTDPTKAKAFFRALKSFQHAAPIQRELLRTSALISLMSYLEALIADLIHAFYNRHPAAMPAEDRTISLAELREIGSVEEAEQFLVAKEVDSVLRESLDSQLRYFAKRPKIDIDHLEGFRQRLIEIDQRRNLLVHNQGIVNRTYLQRVAQTLIEEYSAKNGERLVVTAKYMRTAIDIVEASGLILLQQCWRKWDKSDMESADTMLINASFEGLQEERYNLVEQITDYAEQIPFASDASKRMACINRAIAFRDSGSASRVEEVLRRYDWSACGLDFQVALAAVRGDEEEFFRLLPRALTSETFGREECEAWPLFRNFRETERFRSLLHELVPTENSLPNSFED